MRIILCNILMDSIRIRLLYTSIRRLCQVSQNREMKSVSPALIDSFGREHTYLRVSLTERCNLRCQYCMPENGVPLTPKSNLLTTKEIIDIISVFVNLGLKKIRFTGGEPLLRPDITDIISNLSQMKQITTIALTTNGLTLYKKLDKLKSAGLNAVNISLDTLVEPKFELLTRRKGWNHVLKSIHSALEKGFKPVKINCVVMKGINDEELCSFVEFTKYKDVDVRFIEYSPFDGNRWEDSKMLPYLEMVHIIKSHFPDIIRLPDPPCHTAKAYKVSGYVGQIGFISSMSHPFCGSCNRLRLTADGNLKVCLFGNEETSLRDVLRKGATQHDLINLISTCVRKKKKQHADISAGKGISGATLTHVDQEGRFQMVDVGSKVVTRRTAQAEARVELGATAFQLVQQNQIQKGDVLALANVAGILAAKKTADLIPLCHSLQLECITIRFQMDRQVLVITSAVTATGKTGIEMEALTAVSVAALTVYDMCKAVSKEITIRQICLLSKTGGKRDFLKTFE